MTAHGCGCERHIVAALATDGAVRTSIRLRTDELFTPWYVVTELDAHQATMQAKSGLALSAFETLREERLEQITVVSRAALREQFHTAARGLYASDLDDTLSAAAALAVDGTVVSNDHAFEQQTVVPHMWTSEFVERAFGLTDDE